MVDPGSSSDKCFIEFFLCWLQLYGTDSKVPFTWINLVLGRREMCGIGNCWYSMEPSYVLAIIRVQIYNVTGPMDDKTHVHAYKHIYTCIYTRTNTYTCIRMFVRACVRACVFVYAFMYELLYHLSYESNNIGITYITPVNLSNTLLYKTRVLYTENRIPPRSKENIYIVTRKSPVIKWDVAKKKMTEIIYVVTTTSDNVWKRKNAYAENKLLNKKKRINI